MAYSSGTINTAMDFTALFDTFLLANGWTKTVKSATITVNGVTYHATAVGTIAHIAGALDNIPIGARASFSGIVAQKVYVVTKLSSTSTYIITDSSFTNIGATSVGFSWDLYTKGTKNITFVGCRHAGTGFSIDYILSDIFHNDTGFNNTYDSGRSCVRLDSADGVLPSAYQIFSNTNPDTISVVFNANNIVDHMHFGDLVKVNNSAFVGGEFLTASSNSMFTGLRTIGSSINETSLLLGSGQPCGSGGFFANTTTISAGLIHCEIDTITYASTPSGGTFEVGLTQNCTRKLSRGLNQWNGQTLLVTIELQFNALSNFKMYLGFIEHIRFVRTDNYNINDIITIGSDQWKVFPMCKKNSAIREGNSSGTGLSGTIGFAVRYTP
jgi:hypothetical protein